MGDKCVTYHAFRDFQTICPAGKEVPKSNEKAEPKGESAKSTYVPPTDEGNKFGFFGRPTNI